MLAIEDHINEIPALVCRQDGLVLCGILHRYRPELVPFEKLTPESALLNNQLAFEILETEFGVPPVS